MFLKTKDIMDVVQRGHSECLSKRTFLNVTKIKKYMGANEKTICATENVLQKFQHAPTS